MNSLTNLTSVARQGPDSAAAAEPRAQALWRRQAKALIQDLFVPKPVLYWTDFLITVSIAYGFAAMYIMAPAFSLLQITTFLVSGVALFRVGTFIHEIVHMPRGSMVGFRIAWNLVCGVPLLIHSLLYNNHLDHHNPHKYGTPADGEYLPLASAPMRETLLYPAQVPILPVAVVFRALVLVPLSFLHPRLRRGLLERASSYGTNPYYRRTIPPTEHLGVWAVMDLSCCLFLVVILALLLKGLMAWTTLGLFYGLATYAIGLNWIRTLAAHRYVNQGSEMTFAEQLEDSIIIEARSIVTLLLFPVGLRYHGLHHLFPSLPYHALGEAHRRLMNTLPAGSPYRKTCDPGFFAVLLELFRGAHLAGKRAQNPVRLWRSANANI